jgi:2-polyprenyl-3-methyl-5-hydroxy-6-metoxy-1,4-benzoquinol methylase
MSGEPSGAGAEVLGIDDVREKNFKRICQIIKTKFPTSETILDVGSSRGLFLKVAKKEGFIVTGLEPDSDLAQETISQGFDVINGFFPDEKELLDKKYDIIIFNDSLEHIPDLENIIGSIKQHLNKNGGLIINIPTSDGLMFALSSLISRFGFTIPLDRLWQKGFASPHVHYFNAQNLELLLKNNGFKIKYSTPLCYYTLKGLWKRLICKSSFLVSLGSWIVLTIFYPLFVVKSDCFVSFFTLKDS